jgi:DNA polymerase III subunit epsilon
LSWADGPLVGFDLETTGKDPETVRIVTASVIATSARGAIPGQQSEWLINPGIDIPQEATAIHGITTKHAQDRGRDATSVIEIAQALLRLTKYGKLPLVIYNAAYDLTVLEHELHRHGYDGIHPALQHHNIHVIDPMVIDREKDRYRPGRRTLEAVCAQYDIPIPIANAHNASNDALAAGALAYAIAARFSIGDMPLEVLHANQIAWSARQAESYAQYLEIIAKRQKDPVTIGDLEEKALQSRRKKWPLKPLSL